MTAWEDAAECETEETQAGRYQQGTEDKGGGGVLDTAEGELRRKLFIRVIQNLLVAKCLVPPILPCALAKLRGCENKTDLEL